MLLRAIMQLTIHLFVTVEQSPKAYIKELDGAVERERQELGKKPFDLEDGPPPMREIQQSKADPESGQLHNTYSVSDIFWPPSDLLGWIHQTCGVRQFYN